MADFYRIKVIKQEREEINMIKIAICDDDVKFTGQIENFIMKIAKIQMVKVDVDVFFDGSELVDNIYNENPQYDIIFLDIEMKSMNGIDVARKIRGIDEVVSIIYVTGYTSYSLEAYEVQPFQFLVKPIDENVLNKYFFKVYEKIIAGDQYFRYKYGKDYYKLLVKDILYFQSKRRVVFIHKTNGSIMQYYDKLDKVEVKIEPLKFDFWRIHQSYLVNTRYITQKSYDRIKLINGEVLFISEDRRKSISELYWKKIEGDIIE